MAPNAVLRSTPTEFHNGDMSTIQSTHKHMCPKVLAFQQRGHVPLILWGIGVCAYPLCKLPPLPHAGQSSLQHVHSTREQGTVHLVL